MLQFVSGPLWTQLFGKPADALEKSKDQPNAFMIRDESPITNFFISVPRDAARFNPASFLAGIVRGVLDSAGFVSFPGGGGSVVFGFKLAGPGSLWTLSHTAPPPALQPCTVQAVTVPAEGDQPRDSAVYLVKFDESVAAREAAASSASG